MTHSRCLCFFVLWVLISGYARSAPPDLSSLSPRLTADDFRLHIQYLTSTELQGRRTGTEGERLATDYAASVFQHLGLAPAGSDGTYFQPFEITAGLSLTGENRLVLLSGSNAELPSFKMEVEWRPAAFSSVGEVAAAPVVFAGYGIVAPESEGVPEYDSYTHLDVKGAWVLIFRYLPDSAPEEARQHLSRYSNLRYKAMVARDLGAAGLIIVSGPNSKVSDPLVPLASDASLSGSSIAVVSAIDSVGNRILSHAGKTLKELQDALDTGDPQLGFTIEGVQLRAKIDIHQEKRTGRNVIARLQAGDTVTESALAIGAHIDHLGIGPNSSSLAKDEEKGMIHFGADDNASGTAGLFEIAQWLVDEKRAGNLTMKRDVLFAAWSGEEMGLLGSNRFVETWPGARSSNEVITPGIGAYLNMDMIGRLRESLVLFGTGSSTYWPAAIERCNAQLRVPIVLKEDAYLPSDGTSFQLKSVPSITAFTGAHPEYHSPRDTADLINYNGAVRVAQLMGNIAKELCATANPPEFVVTKAPEDPGKRAGMRAYLGTIPDYAQTETTGVKLAGVTKGAPADKAGVKSGDIVIGLGGKKIENIYDYTYAIEAIKIGEKTSVVVLRGTDKLTLDVTPGSRE